VSNKMYDYCEEGCGFVSLWLGNFKNENQLDDYLDTVYQDFDNETDSEFQQRLNKLFLPENANRPCEQSFKELFDEFYNQFEYDFGITHDEDFRERSYLDTSSSSISVLIGEHSYAETFIHYFVDLFKESLDKKYNTVILIYDCHYDGYVKQIHHDQFDVEFFGSVPFEKGE